MCCCVCTCTHFQLIQSEPNIFPEKFSVSSRVCVQIAKIDLRLYRRRHCRCSDIVFIKTNKKNRRSRTTVIFLFCVCRRLNFDSNTYRSVHTRHHHQLHRPDKAKQRMDLQPIRSGIKYSFSFAIPFRFGPDGQTFDVCERPRTNCLNFLCRWSSNYNSNCSRYTHRRMHNRHTRPIEPRGHFNAILPHPPRIASNKWYSILQTRGSWKSQLCERALSRPKQCVLKTIWIFRVSKMRCRYRSLRVRVCSCLLVFVKRNDKANGSNCVVGSA